MYDNSVIVPLRGPDRVRKRPAVLFGSNDAAGCKTMILELIDYFVQEFQLGCTDRILITKCRDGSYIIEDNGSGILIETIPNTDLPGWEETFCGEFSKRYSSDKGTYDFSLGSSREEQLRSSLKCDKYISSYSIFAGTAASRYLDATVIRDGYEYTLHFQKGFPDKPVNKRIYSGEKSGTCLHFLPDEEVFSSITLDFTDVFDYAAEQAALNPGLEFVVKDCSSIPEKEETFCYIDGLKGMLMDKLGLSTTSSNGVMHFCWKTIIDDEMVRKYRLDSNRNSIVDGFEMRPPYLVRFEVAYTYSPGKNLKWYFHNFARLEHGGVLRSAILETVKTVGEQFLKKGVAIDGLLDDFSIFVSTVSERTSWDTARHTGVVNRGIYNRLKPILQQLLYAYFDEQISAQVVD